MLVNTGPPTGGYVAKNDHSGHHQVVTANMVISRGAPANNRGLTHVA